MDIFIKPHFYLEASLIYSIAILALVIGYFLKNKKRIYKNNSFIELRNNARINKKILILFFVFYAIVIINSIAGGISFSTFTNDLNQSLLGYDGVSNYFQNFVDSLIILILLGVFFKQKKGVIVFQVWLAFSLFLILGFRYRIILTLIGIAVIYILTEPNSLKISIKKILLLCFFAYLMMFITINRYQFTYGNFTDLEYDPSKLGYELFFEQTRGFIADSIVINHYSESEKDVGHDYGVTMFLYPFLTATPRLLLPNKDDFYPPPQIELQKKIYESPEAINSGEALLNLGYMVISFGVWGAIIGSFIFGLLINKLEVLFHKKNAFSLFIYFSVLLACFQWITRGYFPQAITHLLFFLIPVILLMNSLKEVHINSIGQFNEDEF